MTLVRDLGKLIVAARQQVAVTANAALTTLYWQLGQRIRTEVLEGRRAEYGPQIVAAVGRQLETQYGRGFGEKNLRRMVQFSAVFPDAQIVATLRRQLGWAHFKLLIPLKNALQREFYAEMCRVEGWSTRDLSDRIDAMLYERTALSKKPEDLIRQELADTYSEKDLEAAILREIERFLLELGAGFAFVERQKRIVLDGDDYYIDLLFFHRRMRRLVVIELKIGDFKPSFSVRARSAKRWSTSTSTPAESTWPSTSRSCLLATFLRVDSTAPLRPHAIGLCLAQALMWTSRSRRRSSSLALRRRSRGRTTDERAPVLRSTRIEQTAENVPAMERAP